MVRCEYLTKKYYNDFEFAYKANDELGEMEFFKVLSCDGKNAEVYYVSKDYAIANILTFVRVEGKWIYNSWKSTVWTNLGGSADEVVWPYLWQYDYIAD